MRGEAWRRWLMAGGLTLLALWLGTRIWDLAGKADLAVRQARETKAAYAELEARKATLEANLDTLATPLGHDAAIREAFGVAKPGEEVIVVMPSASSTATTTLSWWQQVLGWF